MKNILILLSVIFITLTSCDNNSITKDNGDQYMEMITDKINDHNKYWVTNGYEGDTMSFVGIDTIVNIDNCAVFSNNKDTSKIKIINHATATLVFVTVKMYSKGYYSKETIVFHLSSLNPKSVYMEVPDMDYETMIYEPIDMNKVISQYRKDEQVALKEYKENIQHFKENPVK
jgi:hypothetical protein